MSNVSVFKVPIDMIRVGKFKVRAWTAYTYREAQPRDVKKRA